MKNLVLMLGLLIGMMSAQAQSLATFDVASKSSLNAYSWTEIRSNGQQMQIDDFSVEFVADNARMTHKTSVQNHISKNSYTSLSGEVIKGILRNADGKTIGTARFAVIGTSMAGNADIGNNSYKFRPDKDGKYYWEMEAPFQCGTEDVDHDCDVEDHNHGAKETHQNDAFLSVPVRNPTDCSTESIQDVAFITDDLMTAHGDDLNAILAQIAISDSWAVDVMNDSGFPDIQFFQESINVVDFNESGTTWYNMQAFSDSLYGNGIISGIMQAATSSITVLYSLGGGKLVLQQFPFILCQQDIITKRS